MKKLLLLGGLALCFRPALAQTTPAAPTAQPIAYQYCALQEGGSSWYLDYGQSGKPAAHDTELDKDNIAIEKMKSGVLALNYLSSRGWEFLGITTYSSSSYSSRTSYLLRRRAQ